MPTSHHDKSQTKQSNQHFLQFFTSDGSQTGPSSTAQLTPYLNASFCHTQNARYRPTMEDASKVISNFQNSPGNGYFAVFDGHAGSMAAKWCANNLYRLLARNLTLFSQHWPINSILALTFDQADTRLCQLPDYDNSGCTAALVYVKSELHHTQSTSNSHLLPPPTPSSYLQRRRYSSFSQASPQFLIPSPTSTNNKESLNLDLSGAQIRTLYTANVGDSRIILSRNGTAHRLTSDHRASDHAEISRIKSQGGIVSGGRVDGSLAVSRALGDKNFKPHVSARPYTSELVLDNQDEFVVLACDGVWDVCSDQSIIDLIRDIEDPVEASQEVVRHALFKGSTDNVTCMVVRLKKVNDCYNASPASSASTTPICIPHSTPTSPIAPVPQDLLPREIKSLDTANLPDSAFPLKARPEVRGKEHKSVLRNPHLEVPDKRRALFDALLFNPPISPAESDLTISEEDEEENMIGGVEMDEADGDRDTDELIYEGFMGVPEVGEVRPAVTPTEKKLPPSNRGLTHSSHIIQGPKEFLHHMRATSFSPSTTFSQQRGRYRKDSTANNIMNNMEFEQDTEVSSLDRYGRFKRIVCLEYDYEGDECAIAEDSD